MKCVSIEKIGNACIFVSLDLGQTAPESTPNQVFLRIHSSDESPSLSTPAQLKAVFGYSFKCVDGGTTAEGAFETVRFIQPDGAEEVFHFKAGESIGVPEPNFQGKPASRVQMVDAEGWATLSNPTYYDLYPGDGSVWRFLATGNTNERGALVSYTDSRGKVLSLGDFGVDIVRDSLGNIRQIVTPSRIADVQTISPTHYAVSVYAIAEEPEQNADTGLYAIPEREPTRVLDVAQGESVKELLVGLKKGGGDMRRYRYLSVNGDWVLYRPDGLVDSQEIASNEDESSSIRIHSLRSEDGALLSRSVCGYSSGYWGYLMTNRVEGVPGNGTRTTRWDYYTSGVHRDLLREIEGPTGDRVQFEYDTLNRVSREFFPLTNEETLYSYDSVDETDIVRVSDSRPRTVVKTREGIEIERTYYVFGTNGVDIVERVGEQGAAYGGTNVLRTIVTYYPVTGSVSDGRIQSVRNEDGSLDCYQYALDDGKWIETTIHVHELAPEPRPFHTTRDVSVSDRRGNMVRTATELLVENGCWEAIEAVENEYDLEGNLICSTDLAGRTTTSEWGGYCCGKTSETAWNGITTVFAYDDNGNTVLESVQQPTPVDIVHVFDEQSREVLSYMTNRTDGLGSFPMRTAYDSLGRVVGNTNEHGTWETHAYSDDGLIETIEAPDVTTRIIETLPDGRLARVRGTPEETRCYVYGVSADGSTWTKTVRGPNPESTVSRTEFYDMLGRLFKREEFGTGGGTITTVWTFDEHGRIIEQKRIENKGTVAKTASILSNYDPVENNSLTALDMNGNGTIDLSGPDRVSDKRIVFVRDNGSLWRETRIYVYGDENSAVETVVSVEREQLTGLGGAISRSLRMDADGNETAKTEFFDRNTKLLVEQISVPGRDSPEFRFYQFGLNVSNVYARGDAEIISCDGLGRETGRTAIENGAVCIVTSLERDSLGRIASFSTSSGEQEFRHYDLAGRIVSVERNDGYAVTNRYNPDGNVLSASGTCLPKWYSYDEYGRVSEMFVGGDSNASNRLSVSYRYDPNTDKVVAKKSSCGGWTTFDYGLDGRLATKTSPRGISTTNEYSRFGDLLSTSHSDGTPSVRYGYDRMGRVVSIEDGTGIHRFAYDGISRRVVSELLPSGRELCRGFDDFGRNVGVELDSDYAVATTFDSTGRVSKIDSTCGTVSNVFRYAYEGNLSLPSQISHGAFTRNLAYKPESAEIEEITDGFESGIVAGWRYEYAPWNRTQRELNVDGSEIIYDYDDMNELKGWTGSNDSFAYEYDLLGNLRFVSNATEVVRFGVDSLGRASNANGTAIEYDADGDIVSFGPVGFLWNAKGQLVSVSSNGIEIAHFEYDYMGRCVRKTESGVSTEFVYDGWRLLEQCNGTNKTMFVWGVDRFGDLKSDRPVGALLSVVESGQTYFPIYDGKGTIRRYADENGTVVASYDYDGFGGTIAQSGELADKFLHRFSTRPFEPILGLYYYGHRFYNPLLARWLSPDPIQEMGGANLYAFSKNNPIDNWDYLGLSVAAKKHKRCVAARRYWISQLAQENSPIRIFWNERKGNEQCEIPPISCKCCTIDRPRALGYYQHSKDGSHIYICENKLKKGFARKQFGSTLTHELVHALQRDCYKWANSDCTNKICKEIQAYAHQHVIAEYDNLLAKDKRADMIARVASSSRCACFKEIEQLKNVSCKEPMDDERKERLEEHVIAIFDKLFNVCSKTVGTNPLPTP